MTKLLTVTGTLALAFGLGMAAPALACDDDAHAAKAKTAEKAPTAKVEHVSLEGKVVTFGCPMEAAKQACTGAALVVGDVKHPIKGTAKGREVVAKARDTEQVVKVKGTTSGAYLTVASYSIVKGS